MTKRYILFDLDGTITDSSEGITKSVQHALKKLGIEENDQAMLRRFIGPPLDESFEKFYGFDKVEEALLMMKDKPRDLIQPIVFIE